MVIYLRNPAPVFPGPGHGGGQDGMTGLLEDLTSGDSSSVSSSWMSDSTGAVDEQPGPEPGPKKSVEVFYLFYLTMLFSSLRKAFITLFFRFLCRLCLWVVLQVSVGDQSDSSSSASSLLASPELPAGSWGRYLEPSSRAVMEKYFIECL